MCRGFFLSVSAVYPRWRGELVKRLLDPVMRRGLSPLARGTLFCVLLRPCHCRFIPAGAGNSSLNTWSNAASSVYPRWRGELYYSCRWREISSGLSPLARGTHRPNSTGPVRRRFIPAGAGNSTQCTYPTKPTAVYPRWRGELCKHNLLLINDFLSQSQSTNFIVSHKQHIHYVKEHLIH